MENENENENEIVEEMEKENEATSPSASASASALASTEDQIHVSEVEGGPKGFGLKKWRRLKRESTKDKDTSPLTPLPDPIRLLKRSSSPNNFIDRTHAADASVSSTDALAAPIFTPGPADSDNSDDRSSKSSTAASAPKSRHRPKSLSHPKAKSHAKILPPSDFDSSKKHQPHASSSHYDNPFSSVDSDPTINGTHNSDVEPSFTPQSQTHFSSNNATHHSPNANCGNPLQASADPLVNSIHMLRSAQIALDREVERFKELGKEIHLLCDDSNEKDGPFDGWSNKNVETLETQVSEAEGRVKEREMKIVELEEAIKNMIASQNGIVDKRCQDMEAEVDSIIKEKIEAEIEHLLITRCSKELNVLVEDEMKVMRGQKGMAKEEINDVNAIQQGMEGGDNITSMWRKAVSSAKCFGIQLSLLLLVLALFILRLTPKSAVVVPT